MIVEILLIVSLFLWFLAILPIPQHPYPWASSWLAWIVALLLTIHVFYPAGMH
jgi:hypothetical protein